MADYTFRTDVSKDEYENFVSNHPYNNLLQSWNWAKIKSNWGHEYTVVEDKEGKIVAAALVLIKNVPGGFTMMYIPRGPIMDYKDGELLKFYVQELKKLGKKHKALFIKLDPAIHINDYASKDYNENWYPDTQLYMKNFEDAGCIHQGYTKMIEESIQPRFQSVVYKTDDLEGMLPKHTKRLIKDSDRRNVQIIHGGKELVDEFARLVSLTEERKGVALRNKDYFNLLMDTYGDDAVIFLAKCNVQQLLEDAKAELEAHEKEKAATPENAKKKLRRIEDQITSCNKRIKEFQEMIDQGLPAGDTFIAGILSIKYGDICEMLYAGMDERFKSFMPQYKEYVENFRWAFDRDCRLASMGGVEGTLDDGLTRFKDNFNPTINEFIGEFDIPVNSLLYKPSKIAYEKMKGKMRN